MTAVAVLAAMACVWLLVPDPGPGLKRLVLKTRNRPDIDPWKVVFALDAVGLVLGVFFRPVAVVAALCLAGTTLAWVVVARLGGRRALRRTAEVVRAAQILESLMGLGHLPGTALELAAEECPMLAPAVAAQRMGNDPWEAMEQMSSVAGQEGLSQIGRAWRVCHICGGSMHATLEQVRKNLEGAADTAVVVAGELAGPRATGQILSLLPLLGLGMAYGIGADPFTFFLEGILGRACLSAGIGFICAGVVWSEVLARGVGRKGGT